MLGRLTQVPEEKGMPVKFEDMMREFFSPRERAAIRRAATVIAKRHLALREVRVARNRRQKPRKKAA